MKKMNSDDLDSEKGFTLIEIMVVMVILGILATFVTMGITKHLAKAKTHAAKTQIELLKGALSSFKLDLGRFPTTGEGLIALRIQPVNLQNWRGPYTDDQLPLDPWGNTYHYKSPGDNGSFDIVSFGADGNPGGEEEEDKDVVSWETAGQSDKAYLN